MFRQDFICFINIIRTFAFSIFITEILSMIRNKLSTLSRNAEQSNKCSVCH